MNQFNFFPSIPIQFSCLNVYLSWNFWLYFSCHLQIQYVRKTKFSDKLPFLTSVHIKRYEMLVLRKCYMNDTNSKMLVDEIIYRIIGSLKNTSLNTLSNTAVELLQYELTLCIMKPEFSTALNSSPMKHTGVTRSNFAEEIYKIKLNSIISKTH